MSAFDYFGAAGLYISKSVRVNSSPRYRRFETAAEALRFAVEEIPNSHQHGALLEMDETRFDHNEIRALYDAPGYPLSRRCS